MMSRFLFTSCGLYLRDIQTGVNVARLARMPGTPRNLPASARIHPLAAACGCERGAAWRVPGSCLIAPAHVVQQRKHPLSAFSTLRKPNTAAGSLLWPAQLTAAQCQLWSLFISFSRAFICKTLPSGTSKCWPLFRRTVQSSQHCRCCAFVA